MYGVQSVCTILIPDIQCYSLKLTLIVLVTSDAVCTKALTNVLFCLQFFLMFKFCFSIKCNTKAANI